jgi:hypothetical protein
MERAGWLPSSACQTERKYEPIPMSHFRTAAPADRGAFFGKRCVETPSAPGYSDRGFGMPDNARKSEVLAKPALGGDCGALAELFHHYRGRLE